MRFPANCLIVALVCGGSNICFVRNKRGRLHVYWLDHDGLAWEFYDKGASSRSYLRNALYLGTVRRAPALDAVTA